MFESKNAVELALAFQPIFWFDPSERFYPVAAEEWLNHLSPKAWSDPDTFERGSAVLEVTKKPLVSATQM